VSDERHGLYELPGTEEPAPQPKPKREMVTVGFEIQTRGYLTQMIEMIGALDDRLAALEQAFLPRRRGRKPKDET
jgi:hypothetical protein